LDKPSGAAFSNPSTSELARDSENTSPTCSANDPSASGKNSESVLIREICGQNSSSPETSNSALDSLRFVFQWVEDFRDGEGNLISIDPWLKNHPQVEVIGRYFQGDEYDEQLERTDVMVLPYRSPYRLRVSRVVIEAMMNGMPLIATRGTTLFEQAEKYGVVVGCEEGSAESLAEAILKAAENFEMMRVSAMQRSTTAAQSFSVGFFRDLLE
jgi:glycosyltransferase involved in cell wall biosynthesis